MNMDGLQRFKAYKAAFSKPLDRPQAAEIKLDLPQTLDLREQAIYESNKGER